MKKLATFKIDEELYKNIKHILQIQNVTFSEFVRKAIENEIKKELISIIN